MIRSIFITLLCCLILALPLRLLSQDGRLESEYKLDIPAGDVEKLWSFIQSTYGQESILLHGQKLKGTQSVEVFIDSYFDNDSGLLADEEISFRYRKRFKDDVLLKRLIQLKTPYSEDKVIRNEIKFEVKERNRSKQIYAGHPLLKYLSTSDAQSAQYHLGLYGIRINELKQSIKLKQTRKRVYIQDQSGESVATITLDEVNNFAFPFQRYAELELELNEIRFTAADAAERQYMSELNAAIKQTLAEKFPGLRVDQRSKYRKMKQLVDTSLLSTLSSSSVWITYGALTCCVLFLFIKDVSA